MSRWLLWLLGSCSWPRGKNPHCIGQQLPAPCHTPHGVVAGSGCPCMLPPPSLPPPTPREGKDRGGKGRGGGFGVWGSLRARGGSPPKSLPPFPPKTTDETLLWAPAVPARLVPLARHWRPKGGNRSVSS